MLTIIVASWCRSTPTYAWIVSGCQKPPHAMPTLVPASKLTSPSKLAVAPLLHCSGLSKPLLFLPAANACGLPSSEKLGSVRLKERAAAPPESASSAFWNSSLVMESFGVDSISACGPIAVSGAGPPRAIVFSPERVTESTATSRPPGVCGPTPAASTVPG